MTRLELYESLARHLDKGRLIKRVEIDTMDETYKNMKE